MSAFEYDSQRRDENTFIGLPVGDNWYSIRSKTIEAADLTGWKVHLSVDKDQVPQAWAIVTDLMQDLGRKGDGIGAHYRLAAKVAVPKVVEKFSDPENPQRGKMITIGDRNGMPVSEWREFLSQIEDRFIAAGIQPGLSVIGDNTAKGSKYAFYRNDQDEYGDYLAAAERDWRSVKRPGGDKFADLAIGHGIIESDSKQGKKKKKRPVNRMVKNKAKEWDAIRVAVDEDTIASEAQKIIRTAQDKNIESAAANPKAWQKNIDLWKLDDSGTREPAIGTIPGLFNLQQLGDLQVALSDNGFKPRIEEALDKPGAHYLAITVPTKIQSEVLKVIETVLDTRGFLMLLKAVPALVASHEQAWQSRKIPDPDHLEAKQLVIRTVPSMFEKEALPDMEKLLHRSGYDKARVQDSLRQGGRSYLAVPTTPENQSTDLAAVTAIFKEQAQSEHPVYYQTAAKLRKTYNTATH